MSKGLIHVGAWDGHEYVGDERRLLLIEPQQEAFVALARNVHGPKAALVRVACGAAHGRALMCSSWPSDNASLLTPAVTSFQHSGRTIEFNGNEEVVVAPLDAVTESFRGFADLVIDTQGYELEVLKGAERTLEQLETVSLEIHDPNVYPEAATEGDVARFMADRGWSWEVDNDHSPGVCDMRFFR